MKIAMVASEANPFVKSGGLADVVYSLSKELAIMGEEVAIFLPFYRSIKEKCNPKVKRICSCEVNLSWRKQGADIFITYADGITYYLIDNDYYFSRTNTYGYMDDGERFAFFNLMVRKIMQVRKLSYDVIHVHDWQCGMLPALIKEQNRSESIFANTKFVITIHNEAFQGMLDRFFVNDFYGLSDSLYDNGNLRLKSMFSTLKSGIVYADKITTVSPTHREELLTAEYGQGLEGVLKERADNFAGILNGIDTVEFDPKSDDLILTRYDFKNVTSGKRDNKKNLLDYFKLIDDNQPVFGLVSRLTWQKGIDLVISIADSLLSKGCSIVVLGSGEYDFEQKMESLRRVYPQKIGIYIGYSNQLAHKIYAGSDFFLMPSLFEPCGIGQMIAERYGTLPIVRNTGGLRDTVISFDGSNSAVANGFSFNDYDYSGIDYSCFEALKSYNDKALLKKLRTNAMKTDNGWRNSADDYSKIYHELLGR